MAATRLTGRKCLTCPAYLGGNNCCGQCQPCRRRLRCQCCQEPRPGAAKGGWCEACARVLAQAGRQTHRPDNFRFPAGHLDRLAARAALGLPLFE